MIKKRLLSFAHFGEAQFFLSDPRFAFKKSSQYDFFFEGDSVDLILTGEGIFQTLFRLTQILTDTRGTQRYQDCLNIGIAGSLTPDLKKYDISQVRTVYYLKEKSFEFQSFTSSNSKVSGTINYDVVTSHDRVIDQQIKAEISGFGDMVDRELWALAFVCHQFNLPWNSYKLISDELSFKTDCKLIYEARDTFAKLLHEKLHLQILPSEKIDQSNEISNTTKHEDLDWIETLLNSSNLHWTQTLKAEFIKLTQLLSSESLLLAQTKSQEMLAHSKLSPKVKAMKIVDELRALTNPLMAEYRNQRQILADTWARHGIVIQFDPKGENLELQFRFKARTQLGLKKKVASLQRFIETENIDQL